MAFALEHFPVFPYPPSGMQEVSEVENYLTSLYRAMQEHFALLPRDIADGISVVELDDLANTELADPNADRIVFWDDSAGVYTWLSPDGTSLEISGTTLQVVADGIDDTHIDWGTGANQVSAVDVPIADAGSYYTGTEIETALQEAMTELKVHQLTGFESASSVALSTDSGNPPTITLTFTGTVYWWSDGVRYSDSGTDALQIGDSSGVHWIYYDGATLSAQVNPSEAALDAIITDKAFVSIVYFNATTNASYVVANELHGAEMSGETHRWLHENIGSRYHGGLTISGYTLDTATNAALTFEVTDGSLFDEDLLIAISDGTVANQYEQQLSGGDASIPVLYRNAGGEWTEQAASTLPYIVSGTTLRYMDADNSYTQTSLGNNQYMNMFLVATNDWQYPIKMIQGTDEYSMQEYSQGAADDELVDWGTLPSVEWVLLYQIILKQSGGESVDGKIVDVIDYRFTGITGASATSQDHGSLSGLGDDDHAQYIKDSEFTQNSGVLVGTGSGTFQEETGNTLRTSLGLAIGTDVLAERTIGIADTNLLIVEGSPSTNQYARFGSGGLEGRAAVNVLGDLSGVANTAFDWNSQNLTSVGTITLQDTIIIGDGTDTHLIKAVQETGLGGRLTLGLDETARTMVLCDYGDIDVDFGLGASGDPALFIFDRGASIYTRIRGGLPNIISNGTIEINAGWNFKNEYALGAVWQLTSDRTEGHVNVFNSAANIELTDTDAEQAWMYLEPKINMGEAPGAGNYVGFLMNVLENTLGSGTNELMALRVGGTDKFTIDNSGNTALADLNIGKMLNVSGAPEAVTIAGGVITVTESYVKIDTQSGAGTDDLDTINGGTEGDIIVIRTTDSARDVVVKDVTGNIILTGSDRTLLSVYYRIMLQYDGSFWVMINKNF